MMRLQNKNKSELNVNVNSCGVIISFALIYFLCAISCKLQIKLTNLSHIRDGSENIKTTFIDSKEFNL